MTKQESSPRIAIPFFILSALAVLLVPLLPGTAQTPGSAMGVLRTEEYRGTDCYRLLRSDGATGFFSLTTGEMVSPWFSFVSFRLTTVSGASAYRVQSRDGQWFFLDADTGKALTPPVDYLSPSRYLGDGGRTFYKARRGREELLLSAVTGTLVSPEGISLSPQPRHTLPREIPPEGEPAAETESPSAKTEDYTAVEEGPYTVLDQEARIVSREDGSRAFQAVSSGKILTPWFSDISPQVLSFQGSPAVTVSNPDQGFTFLSLQNGKTHGEWYDFIGFAPEDLGSRKAYRVSREGKTTFLYMDTGKTLDQWFDSISHSPLTLADKDHYLVHLDSKGDALLSAETGKIKGPWYTKIYPDKETLAGQSYYAAEHPEKGFGYIPTDTGEFTQD